MEIGKGCSRTGDRDRMQPNVLEIDVLQQCRTLLILAFIWKGTINPSLLQSYFLIQNLNPTVLFLAKPW